MIHKKTIILIISVLIILLIPIIIYLFNFNSVAFDNNFYKKEFLKYDVYQNLEDYDAESVNGEVLNYLKNGKNNELIKNDFFGIREKNHLVDVKILIRNVLRIYYTSVILFLLLLILLILLMKFNIKNFFKKIFITLSIGSALTLLSTFLFFIALMNFDLVFDSFHKAFFSFGTYTFNPDSEKIVVLYPQGLFFDGLLKITTNSIISSIFLLSFSLVVLSKFTKSHFQNFLKKFPTRKL